MTVIASGSIAIFAFVSPTMRPSFCVWAALLVHLKPLLVVVLTAINIIGSAPAR
jgi:hypothetical protein